MDLKTIGSFSLMTPFSERNIDLCVLVDEPYNLDDDKDDNGNRNTCQFWRETKMVVSVTLFLGRREYNNFSCLKRYLHQNRRTSPGKCSGLLPCNSFPWLAKMFMLQQESSVSILGVRISNSLRKSSVLWMLSGSFARCSLVVFVMHITDYIMWWTSLRIFSLLKIESLKMSGDAKRIREGSINSQRDWVKLPHDVLGTIITMLGTLTDSCRFGAVCRSWYRAELEDRPNKRTVENNQLPMLCLIPKIMRSIG